MRLAALLVILSAAAGPAFADPASAWHRSVTIDMRVHPDGTADSVETWTVRADNTAVARVVAQQSFGTVADLEQVEIAEAETLKADGTRLPVGPGAVMDQAVTTNTYAPAFSRQRWHTIVFPGVAAGDRVRYVLRRHGTRTLFPGQFTTTLQPGNWAKLDRADIAVSLPPGLVLHIDGSGLDEGEPEFLADGGAVRRWHRAAVGSGPIVLDMSGFDDYAALGRAYAARAWPHSRPTPAVQALADRLTAGAEDEREQASRLYSYVATEVRYVAVFLDDGRVVPRAAGTVLAEGWGDCKDHAALLQALLMARGIAAQPALISLRNMYSLPKAAGLGALNHVITYIPSLDLYLDSTASYAPFGLLPVEEYDKPVVIADPVFARLARTPALPPAPLELLTSTQASIEADEMVNGTTLTAAGGPQAIALRSMAAWIEGRGPAGAASLQLRQLGTPGTGAFDFDPPEPGGRRYEVKARFKLDDPLIDGGTTPFTLPGGLGVFGRPGRLLLGTPATEDGGHACYPGREVEEVALRLPAGSDVQRLPTAVSVEGGGARYESRYEIADGVLRAHRVFTVAVARVFCGAAEYAEMRPVLAAARRDQRAQVALTREAAPLALASHP